MSLILSLVLLVGLVTVQSSSSFTYDPSATLSWSSDVQLSERSSDRAGSTLATRGLSRLSAYTGGKTQGLLQAGSKEIDLISGWSGPASQLPRGSAGFDIVTKTHVEGHAAAIMRMEGLQEAALYINQVPCSSCARLLPRMLPTGAELTFMDRTITSGFSVDSKLQKPVAVVWGEGDDERSHVSSIQELNTVLDRVQALGEQGQPSITDVEVPDQGVMRIAVSSRGAVLSVMRASLDPPYFNSVGHEDDGPDLVFSYRGHWTDFPARFAVPVEDAIEAVKRFASGEFLPANIKWEET